MLFDLLFIVLDGMSAFGIAMIVIGVMAGAALLIGVPLLFYALKGERERTSHPVVSEESWKQYLNRKKGKAFEDDVLRLLRQIPFPR